ncbi:hypothetical protein NE848_02575 [Gramella jeungdoensis]|uniref:Lipocalin-like domain-containing protein n=1 Tax=Gramella jeungdoensis TaxID=708091 RepID=A0ABT0Z0C6_9FLAO|nr:hypothetical protein [Gramella jeungdoensis]MCM8568244.1 hypothetical protein [Gramella jeungdoensis]
MKNIVSILVFLIIFSSCSIENASPEYKTSDENISGKWKLVQASGGIAGNIIEYGENDDRFIIEFRDNEFISTKNGEEIEKSKYHITLGESIRSTEEVPLIIYETGKKQSFEFQEGNLILFDECYDCYQYEYIRI